MPDVVIVDTSVLLNLLNVPGFNQDRHQLFERFEELIDSDSSLLLPMAAVFETGNHIARLADGGSRRRFAKIFCEQVRKALDSEAPWVLMSPPDSTQLSEYLERFPDCAMRGVSMADLSIIRAWEEACKQHRNRRVHIWSLDRHLRGYDHDP